MNRNDTFKTSDRVNLISVVISLDFVYLASRFLLYKHWSVNVYQPKAKRQGEQARELQFSQA